MKFGLIGNPLGHSHSPRLHREFGTGDYALLQMEEDALAPFLAAREFEGVNVTIPYKRAVMPLVDELHPTAVECGAVNTVVNRGGKLVAYNTDAFGMLFALRTAGIGLAGKSVAVLGSGGTSHTACALARREGAKSVVVVSRSGQTDYTAIYGHKDLQVVINTTPVGMYPNAEASPLDLSRFPALEGVFDAVYNPLNTRLVQQAKSLGLRVGSGLLMLTAQAKAAATLFLGGEYAEPSPTDEAGKDILRVYATVRRELTNIVLVGMPSSGKSSLGRLVADKLSRPFADTDALVEANEGKDIPSIFAAEGEAAFREAESRAVAECSSKGGGVIATGGGAPLSERNRLNLRSNGFAVYVRRDTDKLETEGRPLSRDLATLNRMFAERDPVYAAFADVTVDNNGDLGECANLITERFYENSCD